MSIVKSRQNWEGEKLKYMQQFLYRPKYGEFKNKRSKWVCDAKEEGEI
jgi:hypothetical protein